MALIAQLSKLSGRGAGLLTRMVIASPTLRRAEFRLDTTDYLVYKDSDNYTGSAARAEGSEGKRDLQTPESQTRKLALYTREYAIDKTRLKDMQNSGAPNAVREFADRRLAGLAVALAEEFEKDSFQGTDSNNKMLGKLEFIKDANAAGQTSRMNFSQAELAAMNVQVSLKLDTEENQNKFVELLMKSVAQVPGANAIEVNVNLHARLTTIAKRLHAYGQGVDEYGMPVDTFYGRPLIPVPETALPQNESDGANNDNCSLFIVRYAEDLGVCYSTNTGFDFVDFPEIDSKPQGVARMDINTNLTVEKKNAILRLSRIRL